MKKCSYCRGDIEDDVRKCKHCGEWVNEEKGESITASIKTQSSADRGLTSLKQSLNKYKGIAAGKLGNGYWGIEPRDDFPTHEEMVFLFSKIHCALGFETIKIVRVEYPDCVAVRDGKITNIEFEPKLSAFKDHINEIMSCNIIICWEDDLEEYSSVKEQIKKHNVEIIELRKIWEQFKTKETLPQNIEWTEKDFRKLSEQQLCILSAFIIKDAEYLTKEEIQEISKKRGKPTGGSITGLTTGSKKRYPLIMQFSHRYRLEDKCRPLLKKVLKDYGLI